MTETLLNIDVIYLALNLFLLLVFVKVGNIISKGYDYWGNAIWCIVFFSLIQGLRYGRGNDYFHYSYQFEYRNIDTNPFFNTFNIFLESIGITRYSCFIVYAFIFVTCGMCFLKKYRVYAKYTFPCFLIGFLNFNEYVIRQALSYSFVFLFLLHLFKGKYVHIRELLHDKKHICVLILFAFLTISIHTGNIIILLAFITMYFLIRYPIHYIITIPIYFLCVYVLPNIFDFSLLQPLLDFVAENNDRAQEYVFRQEQWFSSNGAEDKYTRNAIIQLFELIGTSSLFFLGYKTIVEKLNGDLALSTMLNVFFVGISFQSLFRNLEILNRIGHTLSYIGFIVLAIVIYHKPKGWRGRYSILYASLIWFFYDYFKYLFMPKPLFTKFIWDAPININFF